MSTKIKAKPKQVTAGRARGAPRVPLYVIPLRDVTARYIRAVLELTGGNQARAARLLGLHRKTLYRRLKADGFTRTVKWSPAPTTGRGEGQRSRRFRTD